MQELCWKTKTNLVGLVFVKFCNGKLKFLPDLRWLQVSLLHCKENSSIHILNVSKFILCGQKREALSM